MRFFLLAVALIFSLGSVPSGAVAQTLEVTVSYRERIALPPDAELEVELVEVAHAATRISSRRFAMTGVPMTVALAYDPQVVDGDGRYAVVAAIWTGDRRMFRTTRRYDAFGNGDAGPVELLLTMTPEDGAEAAPPKSITGVAWSVTEVAGAAWGNDDPATLTIDDEMNFSIFGGCNRFNGQLVLSDGAIAFPENFAGTLMACPGEAEALERSFLQAVRQVSRFVRYGGGLVMTDEAGNALLHFEERPE